MEKLIIDSKGSKLFFESTKDFSAYDDMQRYHNSGKVVWAFDDLYPQAGKIITSLRKDYKVEATRNSVETIKRIVKTPDLIEDHTFLDQFSFKVAPYAHQVGAILRMLYYDRLAIIFEQGLGKTYIALVHLAIRQQILNRRIKMLVIAPRIVAPNWIREASKYTNLKGILLHGNGPQREKIRETIASSDDWDFISTTYDVIGSGQSTNSSGKATKDAKLDFWLKANRRTREMYLLPHSRRGALTQKSYDYLLDCPADGSKKTRAAVWDALKPIQKFLKGPGVLACQQEYSDLEFLKKQNFEVICFDEASRIKNWKAARTQASVALASKCRYRYHLSGTLCNGNPADFYAPFTVLNDRIWSSYTYFMHRYFTYNPHIKHMITGYKNLVEMKELVEPYKYAMTRDQCIALPERLILKIHTPIPEELVDLYDSIVAKSTVQIGDKIIRCGTPIVKLTKLSQLMSGFVFPSSNQVLEEKWCKGCSNLLMCVDKDIRLTSEECIRKEEHQITDMGLQAITLSTHKLDQLEEDLDASDEKTIIWAWYRYDLDVISELLNKKGITYVTASEKNCDKTFEDPNIRVFLGQTSQGIGITLNSATRMIYYSHGFPLESRLQSMDRNYRIGQTNKVLVLDYLDENSLETDVLFLLDHKIDVKTYLQSKMECFACSNVVACHERGLGPTSPECKYVQQVASLEKKQAIGIKPYGR